MGELGEEKIDIIGYSEDPVEFITNALSPTKVINVKLDAENKKAIVRVPEDQLSLAIGKSGQNVRLAAKLTGWNVDIDGADDAGIEATAEEVKDKPQPKKTSDLEDALIEANKDDEKATEKAPEEAPEKAPEEAPEKATEPAPTAEESK
jgi:N utilization substance protein A